MMRSAVNLPISSADVPIEEAYSRLSTWKPDVVMAAAPIGDRSIAE